MPDRSALACATRSLRRTHRAVGQTYDIAAATTFAYATRAWRGPERALMRDTAA